jgi:hypothetical protein
MNKTNKPKQSQKTPEKFLRGIAKGDEKNTSNLLFNCGQNNAIIETYILYLEKYAHIFADVHNAESRNFIKWALSENIKKTQTLLDKITATEKALNLPLEIDDHDYYAEFAERAEQEKATKRTTKNKTTAKKK